MRILRVLIGDAVVVADPLVSMVVSPHAVVQHVPALLDQLGHLAASPCVLGVLADVTHHQNYLFAHERALDGGVPVVEQVAFL